MHPILTQKRWLLLYLAAWLPVAILLSTLVFFAGPTSWTNALVLVLPLAAIYAFECAPVWYLCRSFPLQPPRLLQSLAIVGLAAVLSASLWLFIGSGWATLLSGTSRFGGTLDLFHRAYLVLFAAGVLLFLVAAAANYLVVAAEASREAERTALEMKVLAREAELKALKAQINPHFLFNSLNAIMALISSDPAEARHMCLLLSDFLRKSLKTASAESIRLDEELALLENFLDIERIRFGTRLQSKFNIDGECMSCLVPPLLLQPLVENAVNHGIAHRIEGGEISVQVERRQSKLLIRIANPCDLDRPRAAGNGIGLRNVHSRLAALYGNEARLDTLEKDGFFHAEISLPV